MARTKLFIVSGAMCAISASAAMAEDIVYQPINPSFGGNPLGASHLLSIASAQREKTAFDAGEDDFGAGVDGDTSGTSDADLFVRQLQGRLFSALAGQVTDAIFGENPQDNGTVVFGTTTVEFIRSAGEIRLLIADNLDGSITEIVVPQLIVE